MIEDHGDDAAVQQPAAQVRFLEARDVAGPDFGGAVGQQASGEFVIFAVCGPPFHESVDIAGVIGFELIFYGKRGVVYVFTGRHLLVLIANYDAQPWLSRSKMRMRRRSLQRHHICWYTKKKTCERSKELFIK
ncbi:hypothetical protein AAC691_14230 [Nguyenibacter vanlangensis]|uniref:Uncharacterized protein n=1 Tax=Nguyenibacter vanlangensis TaxID=1216886 RepID=A0ABZ3D126_9PROT